MGLVLDAMTSISDGTKECFLSQSPRNCLKTHEDVIVACGQNRSLCYLPSESKWYELAPMLSSHNYYGHTLSACHGKLYVIGRSIKDGSVAERYELSLNLRARTKAPEMVEESSAAVTLQGLLYVIGGRDKTKKRISTVQRFNPEMNLWQEVASLSSPRSRVCAVADGSYLYAIGGIGTTGQYLDIVERFDPRNNTWDNLPSTLVKRANAGGAAIKKKLFCIWRFTGRVSRWESL